MGSRRKEIYQKGVKNEESTKRSQDGSRHGEGGRALNKQTLSDYIDICELISETEEDIKSLKKQEIVHDKVTGSNPEFPYEQRSFHVSGAIEADLNGRKLKKELELLEERKLQAEKMKAKIDKWMKTIPARMQRIVRMKYFERKTWDEVAIKLGRKVTADSVRMELNNFMREK